MRTQDDLFPADFDGLKQITPADASLCTRLFIEVFSAPPWNYAWVTEEKSGRYINDLLNAPGSLSFFYFLRGKPVGICIGSVNDYFFAPQYKIEEFAVLPSRQRQGVGSLMLDAVEEALKKRGVSYVFLQTSSTIPAYDFYLKKDYSAIPENVFLIKEIGRDSV
ncbi:MAG: GNAT family N-acetyltransferase [Clostridiales bacterium]|jgi:GNAT superfamily N-acetyltransferase|nr:GNAT family N-acetyltransferase [Clostridiales bacterium]